ncbi:MAG: DNA replication complex GINS family protein [Nitrosopumilus sp.]|nr:DNA replication complex GINS family protein [Nitrosopumilus sp.]MDH3384577.1 DNA replication complex GINS family protein [Nitrosopumilus sp.]
MEIEDVEKLHEIGYGLKDAKATLNQDVKFNVAKVKVEGTSGEVMNIPRWVGQIIEDNKLGELDSPDMITELKQALSKEKMVGEYQVSTLEPQFYIKLKRHMRTLQRDDFNHIESMMLELFRMRRGKLVKLADSTKLSSDLYNKITVEESVFFKTIYDNSKNFENQIRSNLHEQGSN